MARHKPPRVESEELPVEKCPTNGLSCDECGAPQHTTPGGPSCVNGHGGAAGVPIEANDGQPMRIEYVDFAEATRLLTYESDEPLWTPGSTLTPAVQGAIVRLRPPADFPQERLDIIAAQIRELGAAAVYVIAPQRSAVVAEQVIAQPLAEGELGARAVVEKMVEESNSKDVERLRSITQTILAKEGL